MKQCEGFIIECHTTLSESAAPQPLLQSNQQSETLGQHGSPQLVRGRGWLERLWHVPPAEATQSTNGFAFVSV